MTRIPLITERTDDLSKEQTEVFDRVVESRGRMIRPFGVLLHAPEIARHVAELGAQIRYGSSLSDHDRELVIIATGSSHGCDYVWDSHLPLAKAAGVADTTIDYLQGRDAPALPNTDLPKTDSLLIEFVRGLCGGSSVSEQVFEAARDELGDSGVVELSATIGYYTLMGYVMTSAGAC
ncbi:MAG: hypothetical protein GEU79_17530 [Acidimicrobiia bacterium]|nr:hypothetical protein [Acidimicrobiia bacterium]